MTLTFVDEEPLSHAQMEAHGPPARLGVRIQDGVGKSSAAVRHHVQPVQERSLLNLILVHRKVPLRETTFNSLIYQ